MLNVDSLCVRAGECTLVRDVSFALGPSERLAIVGRSGAGKSVLAKAIAGLLPPPVRIASGRAALQGNSFYLPQIAGSVLSPCVRIVDQVARVAGSTVHQAQEALRSVGLREASRQFPFQLSGGMRQRVLIAMALVIRPALLIADEPTTGQDPVTQRDILACLDSLLVDTGAAMLFITHDVRAAAQMCPRALVLSQGHVAGCAPWEHLAGSCAAGGELVTAVRTLGK